MPGTLAMPPEGKSAGILNVNPGGSWFSMNDKTSKGKMVPEGNDFATVLHGGAVHTSGKGYTDWGGGIGFNFVGAGIRERRTANGRVIRAFA